MSVKRVYTFGDKKAEGRADMKNLLGGKGANLAEMNLIGVPVPPGFTITTDVCTEYIQVGEKKVIELLRGEVEAGKKSSVEAGRKLGRRCSDGLDAGGLRGPGTNTAGFGMAAAPGAAALLLRGDAHRQQ